MLNSKKLCHFSKQSSFPRNFIVEILPKLGDRQLFIENF
jgi:hypothetical protein